MASSNPAYQAILNDLNRDVAREQPTDIIQFCADWFQDKLRKERNGSPKSSSPSSARGKGPGSLPSFALASFDNHDSDAHPGTLSPFSEQAPDGPFSGPRPAAAGMGAGAPLFSSPFGGASTDGAARDDSSPFSENAPGGPFGSASPFGASPFGAGAQTPSAPVGNVSSDIDEHHLDEPNIPSYALGRRTSVSAESLVPSHSKPFDPTHALIAEEDESSEGDAMPVFPKTAEQLTRIKDAIKPNFLFRNLDEEQEADILAAMKEVTVSPGETVIQQGDAGDYFYIVETGELDCFVKRDDQVIETEKGDRADLGKRVVVYKPGTSFGELALMHNAPRAATIVATVRSTLWALDRVSFRTILLDHTSRKRRMYESFLATVDILSSLKPSERAKIADVLESRTFNHGDAVIHEGDDGDEFFLVESGTAEAFKSTNGKEVAVKTYSVGDYFGELALLNRQTRAATVRASSKLRIVAIGEQAFTRLLGPAKEIMARNATDRYGFSR